MENGKLELLNPVNSQFLPRTNVIVADQRIICDDIVQIKIWNVLLRGYMRLVFSRTGAGADVEDAVVED